MIVTYQGVSRVLLNGQEMLVAILKNLYTFDFSIKGEQPQTDKQGEVMSFSLYGKKPLPSAAGPRCNSPNCARRHRHYDAGPSQETFSFFTECFASLQANGGSTFAENLLEFHRRMAHPNFAYCRNLLNLPASKDNPTCPDCEITKARQRPLPSGRVQRSTRIIHRIHMDLGFSTDGAIFQ